jgi:hypothetical protein
MNPLLSQGDGRGRGGAHDAGLTGAPAFPRDHIASFAGLTNSMIGEEPCTGATIKIEELFFHWLSQKDTADMVEQCVAALLQNQPVQSTAEHSAAEVSLATAGLSFVCHD